ncbi:retrovirus-related pol polyprotein from transposon TNT 1-94 [Tanacetum coccineum]|uniref:Retrovirus-related pol polyprotein from transposon TNT 1-94 n=1 Tax=Tanacetum coccineum TaxID=301880 RepID=A0ABQ5E7U9_9ASTR
MLKQAANIKSGEISDLNAKLQEQGLVIAALKNELRKLKGKAIDNKETVTHSVDPTCLGKQGNQFTTQMSKTFYKLLAITAFRQYQDDRLLQTPSIIRRIKNPRNKMLLILSVLTNKSKKDIWKPTGKVFTQIGYIWRPTGRTFTIVGNACPLTRITTTNEVPSRKPIVLDSESPKPVVVQIVLWYLDSGCSKHMTGDRSQLTNFVSKFLGTVKFGNDQVAKIMGFGDYQIGNVTISRASKTKSWLWHRRLSHLNFGSINHLARHGLVRGLPKLKFEKDHLCSACALGKSSKKPHKPKSEDTNQEKLYLLHMDLCGPMRVASVSGKKYILVIVDDYSRFTWVKCYAIKE